MSAILKNLTAPMDFEGQQKAELLIHIIISTCGVVGIVFGWFQQEYSKCVYTIFAGMILCSLLVVPNWPYYKGTQMKWVDDALVDKYWDALAEKEDGKEGTEEKEESGAQEKKKRKK